ncbi:MAG: prepilin-type N-terminal cleavage/methylation domain-containing protein [Endomicrobia bacterium]|nr:prepilin-type N-terminal cleavage/methylation domain-containing protein [Endomicrobiia bacterium]
MIKNKRGFTSIELMIVLVISAILLIAFAVSRKSQIRAAYLRESDVFITDIVNKQRLAYQAANISQFFNVPKSSYAVVGGLEIVDGRKYLYFDNFEVRTQDATKASQFEIYVYGKDGTEAEGVVVKMKYDDGQLTPI